MSKLRVSGKDLQKAVVDIAHKHGYKVAHFSSVLATGRDGVPRWRTPVQADGKGWPDLFLVRPGRALAIEIKGDGDSLRAEQIDWIERLTDAGIEAVVIEADDWRTGRVETLLNPVTPPPPRPRIIKPPAKERRGI